jgi:RNA polymerase sigma-70 factor (ECF subfamily)
MNGMTMEAEVDVSTTATAGGAAGTGEDDERLSARAIASAKAGDKSAFHYLYTRYADDVYRYVNGIVRHHAQAEDITQNVFLKLMTAIHRYEQREVPFKAWILRVARNAAFDYMRSNRPLVPCEEIFASDEGYEEAGADCWRMVKHGLDELPDDQREVLVLRHIVGLSPGEIGEVLDKTEGSIHGLHHRGRATMQTALRRLGAEPVTAVAPPVTAVA